MASPTTVSLALIFLLPAAPGSATISAQERTTFTYTDADGRRGTFRQEPGSYWLETTGTGEKNMFKEVSRNSDYVELFDDKRGGVGVRIATKESFWKHPTLTRGEWNPLWKGAWEDSGDEAEGVKRTPAQVRAAREFSFEGVSLALTLDQFRAKFQNATEKEVEEVSKEMTLRTYLVPSRVAKAIEIKFANKVAYQVSVHYDGAKRASAGGDEKLIRDLVDQYGAPEPKAKGADRHWRLDDPNGGAHSHFLVTQYAGTDGFTVEVLNYLFWAVIQTDKEQAKKK